MKTLADPTFVFGTFRLLPRQKLLLQAGDKPVQLGGRAFDLLLTLVERAGEVVGKDELLARVWPNSVVEEANLRLHITSLRKALDDGEQGRTYIKNIIGRGYCFVAPVERFETPLPAGVANSKERIDNLPISISRVIGREHLIASVANQLPLQRFITIIGPGGIGKTTVALAIAQRVRKNYQAGVCFIELAPVGISLSAKDALAFPAVQLFVERATASLHSFALTDTEAPIVIEICLQLDGIP